MDVMKVRQATVRDKAFVKSLDEQNMKEMIESYGRDYSSSMFDLFDPKRCLILEIDDVAIGFAYFHVSGNKLDVWSIQINRQQSRRGGGTILMKELRKYAREHELKKIVLETQDRNEVAMRFYRKLGFKQIPSKKVNKVAFELKMI